MPNNIKLFIAIVATFLILGSGFVVYSNLNQDEDTQMRDTLVAHHHLRMQLLIDGKYIDFSQPQFQEEYIPGACSAELPETPIHFHDNEDQLVHIHWDKITGGQVLKYYGLNTLGGDDEVIDYQPADNIKQVDVPIKGDYLPEPNQDSQFWIYTGEAGDYTQRTLDEFRDEDLETFFGKKSQLTIDREQTDITNSQLLGVKANAQHSGMDMTSSDTEMTDEGLKDLQNLIGDVIIFIQSEEPTSEEINERFENLTPLQQSVCAG